MTVTPDWYTNLSKKTCLVQTLHVIAGQNSENNLIFPVKKIIIYMTHSYIWIMFKFTLTWAVFVPSCRTGTLHGGHCNTNNACRKWHTHGQKLSIEDCAKFYEVFCNNWLLTSSFINPKSHELLLCSVASFYIPPSTILSCGKAVFYSQDAHFYWITWN